MISAIAISMQREVEEARARGGDEEARRVVHSNIGSMIGMTRGTVVGTAIGSAILPGIGTFVGMMLGGFFGGLSGMKDQTSMDNLKSAVTAAKVVSQAHK